MCHIFIINIWKFSHITKYILFWSLKWSKKINLHFFIHSLAISLFPSVPNYLSLFPSLLSPIQIFPYILLFAGVCLGHYILLVSLLICIHVVTQRYSYLVLPRLQHPGIFVFTYTSHNCQHRCILFTGAILSIIGTYWTYRTTA